MAEISMGGMAWQLEFTREEIARDIAKAVRHHRKKYGACWSVYAPRWVCNALPEPVVVDGGNPVLIMHGQGLAPNVIIVQAEEQHALKAEGE